MNWLRKVRDAINRRAGRKAYERWDRAQDAMNAQYRAPWMRDPVARDRWQTELRSAWVSGMSTAELKSMMQSGPSWWHPTG